MHPGYPCATCGQQGCTVHRRSAWTHAQPVSRIAGRKLQALRLALFAEHPFCQRCHHQVATIRDHIVPLAEGGADTRENTQALCEPCNTHKAISESVRGRKNRFHF